MLGWRAVCYILIINDRRSLFPSPFSPANYLVLTLRDALSHGGVERAIVQNVVLGLEETTWI